MDILQQQPQRALILGAGRKGSDILAMLLEDELVNVVGIVDMDSDAPGLAQARQQNIPVYASVEQALHECSPCIAFNVTGNEMVEAVASEILGVGGVIGGLAATLMWNVVSNLKRARDDLHFHASHDSLTGLHNRWYMMELLQQGVNQAIRYQHPYTIVMIDLDYFKQVNDKYGHAAGDKVLRETARLLEAAFRDADIAGRWGGEEFLVLMSLTDKKGAVRATEHWLKQLQASPIALDDHVSLTIGASAGIAMIDHEADMEDAGSVLEALLREADVRLYQAKANGRGCVCAG